MAAIDDLKLQNTELKATVVTLGEEVAQQIQQLQDALGDEAAVAEVAADMMATKTKLQQLVTSLQADDPTLPAPGAPTSLSG